MNLAVRDLRARELMDDPACDPGKLRRTYEQFGLVNRLVSGWRRTYVRRLRPLLSADRTTTLLDIGYGGGDVPLALARWARRDGMRLDITGIDPDDRAHAYASALPAVEGLRFRQAFSSELVAEGARFDVVVSNHVLHHLAATELDALLADSEALARRLVLHSDIARSRVAYGAFWVGARPLSRGSFIRHDGLLSIRRSYTPRELAAVAAPGWRVEAQLPYRVLLVHDGTPDTGHGRASGTDDA